MYNERQEMLKDYCTISYSTKFEKKRKKSYSLVDFL